MVDTPPVTHPACPECDGARVEARVRTGMDREEIKLWRPTRRGWGSREVTSVRALACTGCGLVTFHVTDLANLQGEVARHPELFKWDD